MYDLNFLTTAVDKKKKSVAMPILVILAFLIVLCFSGFYVYMQLNFAQKQTNINDLNTYIASDEVASKINELSNLNQKQQLLTTYQNSFTMIDTYLTETNIITGSTMDALLQSAPAGVSYTSVILNGTDLQLSVTISDNQQAAELIYNLKQLSIMQDAELLTINIDAISGLNTAAIHCVLKDVINK